MSHKCNNCGNSGCSSGNCKENRCEQKSCGSKCSDATHTHYGHQVKFCKDLSEDDKKCASKYSVSKGKEYDDIIWGFVQKFQALTERIKELETFKEEVEERNYYIPKMYVRQVGTPLIVNGSLDGSGKPIILNTGDKLFLTISGTFANDSSATYTWTGINWIKD